MVGWKDILRPIRDGLRDQLPPRAPREDDEEKEKRRLQRVSDLSKGFAYLDTFDEIESWTPEIVEARQRANTPLLPRSICTDENESSKARVVLIHDYSGNYHDYEACQGSVVDKESYSCKYMQFIDAFVYFSHKLICVPPPPWTNSLHRNGVRSLGTFLVEPQSTAISKILERKSSSDHIGGWEYPIASKLAEMAHVYGFDGWLLNIEKTFPYRQWDRDKMVGFIVQLRSQLGHGNIIWYDALTTSNILQYQNSLSTKNLAFAQAAGALLTNYAWTPEKALAAKNLALASGLDPRDIIFGIDVWAQNTLSKEHPRRTYGGGGTGTGIAVAELAKLGLSAGIFAPAWPFEHFSSCAMAVQDSMWYGNELPESLVCHCQSATQHNIPDYQINTITRSAQTFAAGSKSFFYTNFELPFGADNKDGSLSSHIGLQSVLPCLAETASPEDKVSRLDRKLHRKPSRLVLTATLKHATKPTTTVLSLYKLDMAGRLEITVTYRKEKTPEDMDVLIEFIGTPQHIKIPSEACSHAMISKTLNCIEEDESDPASPQLTGINVVLTSHPSESEATFAVVEILEICIRKQGVRQPPCSITDICIKSYDNRHSKLTWNLSHVSTNDGDLPCSKITGPVSYFCIHIDAKLTGRAYAVEYLLSEEESRALDEDNDHTIRVERIGFDGTLLCSLACSSRAARKDEHVDESGRSSWQLV